MGERKRYCEFAGQVCGIARTLLQPQLHEECFYTYLWVALLVKVMHRTVSGQRPEKGSNG